MKQLIIFLSYKEYPNIAKVKSIGNYYISLEPIVAERNSLYCDTQRLAKHLSYKLYGYETKEDAIKIIELFKKIQKLCYDYRKKKEDLKKTFQKDYATLLEESK